MRCNICAGTSFVDMGKRPGVRCAGCNSLERHRILSLIFESLTFPPGCEVLVLAPDACVLGMLKRAGLSKITTADFYPDLFQHQGQQPRFIDLANVDESKWLSEHYDLIIHSHVIEHIPVTLAYPLFQIFRLMKPGALQLAVIPFMQGSYAEDLGELPDEERVRKFGQKDHFRRLGADDVQLHLGRIIRMPEFDLTKLFKPQELIEANIPSDLWSGLHHSTVLQLRKEDWLLGTI